MQKKNIKAEIKILNTPGTRVGGCKAMLAVRKNLQTCKVDGALPIVLGCSKKSKKLVQISTSPNLVYINVLGNQNKY